MSDSLLLSAAAIVASGRISKKRPKVVASTRGWYANSMRRLSEFLGDRAVCDVTPDDLADFQDAVEEMMTLSPSTRNNYKRGVRDVFSRLAALGHDVPAFEFDFEKERRGVKRVSDVNHHKLLAATGVRDALMVKWVFAGGVRVGGLNSMHVSTTDYWMTDEGEIHVAARVWEKGRRFRRERTVYGTHSVGLLLCSWLEIRKNLLRVLKVDDHDMLLVNTLTGQPITTHYISGIFWKLKQAAKIPQKDPVNAHAARHAFAIERIKAGMPLNVVSKFLGHSSIKTTSDVYVRLQDDEVQGMYFDEALQRREDVEVTRLFRRKRGG